MRVLLMYHTYNVQCKAVAILAKLYDDYPVLHFIYNV